MNDTTLYELVEKVDILQAEMRSVEALLQTLITNIDELREKIDEQ